MSRNAYPHTCPECGRKFTVGAKHLLRQNASCLACVRKRNGWQHDPTCTADPAHRGTCDGSPR